MAYTRFLVSLVLTLSLASCTTPKKSFSARYYFEGLNALSERNTVQAEKAFRKSAEKDSSLPAGLAREELLKLLYDKNDFENLIALTESNFPDTDTAERFRLAALLQSGSVQAEEAASRRFFSAAFGADDLKLFSSPALSAALETLPEHTQKALLFRSAIQQRNYMQALNILKEQMQLSQSDENEADGGALSNPVIPFFSVYTDFPAFMNVCSAVLYGSRTEEERLIYAEGLKDAASFFPGQNEKVFHCSLYAARLYGRCGEAYRNEMFAQYETALADAYDDASFDRALWYYADAVVKISNRALITLLQTYAPQWHDPAYFDDILSLLSHNLLAARNWQGYYAVYDMLFAYMSPDTVSKYAFIAGRLAETGLLETADAQAEARKALEKSYGNTEGSLYYRLLAAERLDIPFEDIHKSLLRRKKRQREESDPQAERLLKEYTAQGFEEKIYPLFLRFKDKIGTDTAAYLNTALYKKNLYPQALRTAVWAFGQSDEPIKKTELEMLYPRFYTDTVESLCAQYGVPEYLAYALIRSESFFDKDVRSGAGAVGLTQLMKSTAADIARKLKTADYDLLDPRTNAEFGIFYLNELIGRLDGSVLLSMFSYNAGITKVRRWNAAYPELSKDLLLEVLPYKETREYGQKILTAAALYACLYYGKTTHDIVRELMH